MLVFIFCFIKRFNLIWLKVIATCQKCLDEGAQIAVSHAVHCKSSQSSVFVLFHTVQLEYFMTHLQVKHMAYMNLLYLKKCYRLLMLLVLIVVFERS